MLLLRILYFNFMITIILFMLPIMILHSCESRQVPQSRGAKRGADVVWGFNQGPKIGLTIPTLLGMYYRYDRLPHAYIPERRHPEIHTSSPSISTMAAGKVIAMQLVPDRPDQRSSIWQKGPRGKEDKDKPWDWQGVFIGHWIPY